MAKINTYPKLTSINPSDLLIITDTTSSENPTRNITIQELINSIQLIEYPNRYVMNGLVNNLASAGSGGYDFMEWTSNATGVDAIPAIRTTDNLLLEKITFVWLGDAALNIGAGEQIEFTIGSFADGLRTNITNYVPKSVIFTLDSSYNGQFASGQVDVSALDIRFQSNTNIAVVGQETGSVTPNTGELAISFKWKVNG